MIKVDGNGVVEIRNDDLSDDDLLAGCGCCGCIGCMGLVLLLVCIVITSAILRRCI